MSRLQNLVSLSSCGRTARGGRRLILHRGGGRGVRADLLSRGRGGRGRGRSGGTRSGGGGGGGGGPAGVRARGQALRQGPSLLRFSASLDFFCSFSQHVATCRTSEPLQLRWKGQQWRGPAMRPRGLLRRAGSHHRQAPAGNHQSRAALDPRHPPRSSPGVCVAKPMQTWRACLLTSSTTCKPALNRCEPHDLASMTSSTTCEPSLIRCEPHDPASMTVDVIHHM